MMLLVLLLDWQIAGFSTAQMLGAYVSANISASNKERDYGAILSHLMFCPT